MIGITASGAHIPVLRIKRDLIAENWNISSMGGERSIANNDEDSATMAVEASINCLADMDPQLVDGLYFATTTGVYQEKLNAALIATAVDLRRDIVTCDFTQSLRSGTGAIRSGIDAVKGGTLNNVLVTAADSRRGYPGTDLEQSFGDGAATIMIGKENVIAKYEDSFTVCNEMFDVWRNPEDTFVRTWEKRFIISEGFVSNSAEAIGGLLKKSGLEPDQITKVIVPNYDARSLKTLAKKLNFNFEKQFADPLIGQVGFCGAAQPLLMLASALEEAHPGDKLLLCCYGDGSDAMLFTVTDAIAHLTPKRTVKDLLLHKITMPSYAKFLSFSGLVETFPGEPFRLNPSATVTWRDINSIIRCHGSRCNQCGTVSFPIQVVCPNCNSNNDKVETSISRLAGEVFTYSLDNLAGRSDDPVVVQTIAEFGEERIRFYGMMTDCIPSQVKIGMRVGLTFRRLYEGRNMRNYFWKCKPQQLEGNA